MSMGEQFSHNGKCCHDKRGAHRGNVMDGNIWFSRLTPWAVSLALLSSTSGLSYAGGLDAVPMLREGSAAQTPWKRYPGWRKKGFWDTYNTLADQTRSPAAPAHQAYIKVSTPIKGDPEKGRQLAFSRKRGSSCVTCHVMGPKTPELPGNVGPDLSEIGSAGRDDAYLFNYVFDARATNPHSMMLPWGRHKFYSEAEIRDIVAFLKTLKTPASFKNQLDDPAKRPTPVENRDWRDPFVNPAAESIESGGALFRKAAASGKSCVSCHAAPEKSFKSWAASMPKWDAPMKRMISIEEFIYRHGAATLGEKWLMQSPQNLDLAVYLRSLANGEAINVKADSPEAKAAFARGEALSNVRIGQLNLSCQNCHSATMGAGHWMRGQYLGEMKGQIAHFPTWRTSRNQLWDIRRRFQWCNVQIRANELPPDAPEYADLEFYLTVLSNGATLEVPGIRH
jgi:sulfur-oxidizing protein SoxA